MNTENIDNETVKDWVRIVMYYLLRSCDDHRHIKQLRISERLRNKIKEELKSTDSFGNLRDIKPKLVHPHDKRLNGVLIQEVIKEILSNDADLYCKFVD